MRRLIASISTFIGYLISAPIIVFLVSGTYLLPVEPIGFILWTYQYMSSKIIVPGILLSIYTYIYLLYKDTSTKCGCRAKEAKGKAYILSLIPAILSPVFTLCCSPLMILIIGYSLALGSALIYSADALLWISVLLQSIFIGVLIYRLWRMGVIKIYYTE